MAQKAYGPGVSDEKGGVIEGIYALQILHDLGFKDFKQIVFLIETSEERGSVGTHKLIDRLLADTALRSKMETISRRLQSRPGTRAAADLIEQVALRKTAVV